MSVRQELHFEDYRTLSCTPLFPLSMATQKSPWCIWVLRWMGDQSPASLDFWPIVHAHVSSPWTHCSARDMLGQRLTGHFHSFACRGEACVRAHACVCVYACMCTCVCVCSTTQVCVDAVILNFLSVCVDIKRGWLKRATSSVSDFPYATSDGGNQENGIWKGNPCRGLQLFVPVYQIYPPSVSTDFIYLHITFDDLTSCMPASSKLCMVCVQNVCNL